jgi:hypothetical protein
MKDTSKANQRQLKGEIMTGKLEGTKDPVNCKKPGN